MQRRLREQRQRIRALLGRGQGLSRWVNRARRSRPGAGPLIQGLPRGGERVHRERPHLRLETPPKHHHAILTLVDVQGPAGVPPCGLARLRLPVHPPPAPHDPLHMRRRARPPHRQQPGFGLRRRYARQGSNLGVRQLPAGQGVAQQGQRGQGTGDSHPFPGRAHVESHPPAEPLGAGPEARVPSAPGVELADQGEQACGGGVEVCGQLGDLVAEPIELRDGWRRREYGECVDRHGEPSFGCRDSTPWFSSALGARETNDLGTRNDFWSALARPRTGGAWAATGPALAKGSRPRTSSRPGACQVEKARDELKDGGHADQQPVGRTMTPPVLLRRTAWLRRDAPTTHPGSCREPAGPS